MKIIGKVLLIAGILLMITGTPAQAVSGKEKVSICHATSSQSNPWVLIEVDAEGLNGHGDHANDLIGVTSCPVPTTTTGVPLTTTTSTTSLPITTTSTSTVPTSTSVIPTTVLQTTTTTTTEAPTTTTTMVVVPPTTEIPTPSTVVEQTTTTTALPATDDSTTLLVVPTTEAPQVTTALPVELITPVSLVPTTVVVKQLAHTGLETPWMLGLGASLTLIGAALIGLGKRITTV